MELPPLRVVIVDDSSLDAELILRELNRGFATDFVRVDTPGGMNAVLEAEPWDLIVSDYFMPQFSGLDAIALLKKLNKDIPIIIVSGKLGEDAAVETMRAGASDYILKDNLARLVPAIRREMNELSVRRQKKRAEEELRKLYHAVEQSPVSIVITDREGTIEYVNPKFSKLTGYESHEAIGQNPRILKSGETPAEEYQRLWEAITAGHEWHGEFLNKKKNSQLFWERASISAIKDETGTITHFVGVKEDITEQRRIKEAERRSWKLSEAMASASLCFLETENISKMAQILVDRCVEITNASFGFLYELVFGGDARILAVSSRTAMAAGGLCAQVKGHIEREGFFLVAPGDGLMFEPVRAGATVLTNNPATLDHLICRDSGNFGRINSFLGTPLKVGSRVVGMIGLTDRPDGFTEMERREIEAFAQTAALALHSARAEIEHKKAMDQLRQAQKMEAIGQLAGGIAHDFNNLLTVINGYSTLLIHEMPNDSPFRGEVEHILQAGERAADLTHQLLAFSRRQILEPKHIDINHLVKNVEKMLKRLIRENILLTARLAEQLGTVKADPGQVEQIIMNLVVNARDAMEEGGILTIETANEELDGTFAMNNPGAVPGCYVMLAVTDTGVGMSEEVRRKVFEPFFTTKAQGKGTGLGLATVYGIVKQSDGYIQVLSQPGKGSSFRVFLPRVQGKNEGDDLLDDAPETLGSETVLVVEDEEGVLNLVVHTLSARGYRVFSTASPAEAMEIFSRDRERICLLVTDVIMPGMSGPLLADNLREQREDLKILFMSGYTDDTAIPSEASDEHTSFIMKPFTPDALAGKVRELLGTVS